MASDKDSWKTWVIGTFTTFITIGGITWLSAVHAQINEIKNTLSEKSVQIARVEEINKSVDIRLTMIESSTEEIKQFLIMGYRTRSNDVSNN